MEAARITASSLSEEDFAGMTKALLLLVPNLDLPC